MSRTELPGDLLIYNPQYRIIICRECQYAVQPSALDSHLLRHKIYRQARKNLIDAYKDLPLELPCSIRQPLPYSLPIDGLSVISGWRCTFENCAHLCASSKRLRKHWTDVHPDRQAEIDKLGVRVSMQTFFRGALVSYFEVSTDVDDSQMSRTPDAGVHTQNTRFQTTGVVNGPALPTTRRPAEDPPSAAETSTSRVVLDMQHLRYFHLFTTQIAPELTDVSIANNDDTTQSRDIVNSALRSPHIMEIALATAAAWMYLSNPNAVDADRHLAFVLDLDIVIYQRFKDADFEPSDGSLEGLYLAQCWKLGHHRIANLITNPPSNFSPMSLFRAMRDVKMPLDIRHRSAPPAYLFREESPRDAIKQLDQLPEDIMNIYDRPSATNNTVAVLHAINSLKRCLLLRNLWPAITWVRRATDDFVKLLEEQSGPAHMVLVKWYDLTVKT